MASRDKVTGAELMSPAPAHSLGGVVPIFSLVRTR